MIITSEIQADTCCFCVKCTAVCVHYLSFSFHRAENTYFICIVFFYYFGKYGKNMENKDGKTLENKGKLILMGNKSLFSAYYNILNFYFSLLFILDFYIFLCVVLCFLLAFPSSFIFISFIQY